MLRVGLGILALWLVYKTAQAVDFYYADELAWLGWLAVYLINALLIGSIIFLITDRLRRLDWARVRARLRRGSTKTLDRAP
jgi:hypothetical protein